MYPASWLCHPASVKRPPPQGLQALLARASSLRTGPLPLLAGKRLGLMCANPASEESLLFLQAAQELGAHVAMIPPHVDRSNGHDQESVRIGRLLGRLYDAVECQGINPDTVRQLALAGNMPVFAGLASRKHLIFTLTEKLDGALPLETRHRCLVQAALSSVLN